MNTVRLGTATLREDGLMGTFLLSAGDASVKSGGGNIEMGTRENNNV